MLSIVGLITAVALGQNVGHGSPDALAESRSKLAVAFASSNERDRIRLHEEGLELVEKVLEEEPQSPEALALFAGHKGSLAGIRKNLWSLFAINSVEAALVRLQKIDPDYLSGASDRGLGSIYLNAPPIVSLGDRDRARFHIERAIKKFPDHPGNQLAFAELKEKEGLHDQAVVFARKVLVGVSDPKYRVEAPELQKKANQILGTLGDAQSGVR